MAEEQGKEQERNVEMNEALERDLRAVLGWDEEEPAKEELSEQTPQNQKPENNQPPEDEEPKQTQQKEPSQDQEPEPTVDLDGEKVPVSRVREWRKGHLMESDYVRKTQQLSEERRRLEQEQQRLQPLLQVERFLQANPHIAQRLQQALAQPFGQYTPPVQGTHQQRPAPGQQAPAPAPQMPVQGQMPPIGMPPMGYTDPALMQRISRLETQHAENQLDRELQSLRSTVSQTRSQLGLPDLTDAEWNEVSNRVMNEAYQTKAPDLGSAFRASTIRDEWTTQALQVARQAAAQQQQAQQRQAAGAVMTGAPRGSGVAPGTQQPAATIEDATKRAYADLRSSGVSLLTGE